MEDFLKNQISWQIHFLNSTTPVPINNLLALHKQYTNCPSNLAGYEAENLYKRLLFIRNIL